MKNTSRIQFVIQKHESFHVHHSGSLPNALGLLSPTELVDVNLRRNSLTGQSMTNYTSQIAQHLDSRWGLLPDPSIIGAGGPNQKTRLASSTGECTPHFIYKCFLPGPLPTGLGRLRALMHFSVKFNAISGELSVPPRSSSIFRILVTEPLSF